MKRTIFPATAGTALLLMVMSMSGCSASAPKGNGPAAEMLGRSIATLDSVYSLYDVDSTALLAENYPFDESFKATYLAEGSDQNVNRYSYLWPYSGTSSATVALFAATGDSTWVKRFDGPVADGLKMYRDTVRTPAAYASYINTAPQSDRFYDDNIWLGLDFSDMYLLTHRPEYLDEAKKIWKFIESGTDDKLGGGIYWCEQRRESKNSCSNAPGTVYALKLYEATSDTTFLEKGKSLYAWTKEHLQDSTDCLYFDNINLSGDVDRRKYAYNSGQMLQAAAMLYRLTGEKSYLDDAQCIAASAFNRFFSGGEAEEKDGAKFRLLDKGNIWFTAVMMRGFRELYAVDGNPTYMDGFVSNLDHAWNVMRDPQTGLFNEDWSGVEKRDSKWLLTQGAMSEMMATASEYLKEKSK